ncbi:unnamed protein product [Lactuca saligna]|uniref:Uncharacterized protein n=1 Tax=Lactuca saligna TaxID=75948 RepID=A0AA35YF98_LACSI|nr:unnamed protein product [Lactuca saligna]
MTKESTEVRLSPRKSIWSSGVQRGQRGRWLKQRGCALPAARCEGGSTGDIVGRWVVVAGKSQEGEHEEIEKLMQGLADLSGKEEENGSIWGSAVVLDQQDGDGLPPSGDCRYEHEIKWGSWWLKVCYASFRLTCSNFQSFFIVPRLLPKSLYLYPLFLMKSSSRNKPGKISII